MIEAVAQVGPQAHVQAMSNPFERHGGLRGQAFEDGAGEPCATLKRPANEVNRPSDDLGECNLLGTDPD
jgi:hypothetical protein